MERSILFVDSQLNPVQYIQRLRDTHVAVEYVRNRAPYGSIVIDTHHRGRVRVHILPLNSIRQVVFSRGRRPVIGRNSGRGVVHIMHSVRN
jgi:hypothetical protein